MRIGKIGVVIIALVPFNVYGECTPTPDCASIGYTETSCETDYLACPFDSTKLKCMPCDSSYRYDCSGDNITGGTGSACGGKYVACECDGGLPFNNGICPQNCTIGMIYYSDKTCSAELDNTKTPIGIVVKDNELIMSNAIDPITWGGYGTNISEIPDIEDAEVVKTDFNGKANTLAIVSQLTSGTASDTAAIYCYEYAPTGMESTKRQWYLPAAGEIYTYVYGNYGSKLKSTATDLGWNISWSFGSSSEYGDNKAWEAPSNVPFVNPYDKNATGYKICCFLEIK